MNTCQSCQYNSSDVYSLENVYPEILKWIPQSITSFAKSHFPFVAVSLERCKNGENNLIQSLVIHKKNIFSTQSSAMQSSKTMEDTQTLIQKIESTEIDCKELVTQELNKLWEECSNQIGFLAVAIFSTVLVGYGSYKIYKKYTQREI